MGALKLVVDNSALHRVVKSRPYKTHYYYGAKDKIVDFAKTTSSGSPIGALRAAAVQVMLGRYEKAVVHGESGEQLFSLTLQNSTLRISGLFDVWTFE